PERVRAMSYAFVIVRNGGTEGVVRVEGEDSALQALGNDPSCRRIDEDQLRSLREEYQPIRTKQRFQPDPTSPGRVATLLDKDGNPVIETVQTVRAGFYMIDVPLASQDEVPAQ